MSERTHCEQCTGLIIDGQCRCGVLMDYTDIRAKAILIYRKVLFTYKFHLEQGRVEDIFGCSLPEDDIQIVLFKGTAQENEFLKEYIRSLRTLRE